MYKRQDSYDACITDVVLSDDDGDEFGSIVGDCVDLPCPEDVDQDGLCDWDDDCVGAYDDCGVCNGGNADQDCNGDCYGDAYVDDCGICSEGNSGHEANSDQDDCGACFGDNSSCTGCTDETAYNYNDGCYDTVTDEPVDCLIDDGSCEFTMFYTDVPDNTGVTEMVVINNILGLEYGDEIGLFDMNGQLNSNDCSNQYGELLVGSGRYEGGDSMNILTVGSIDYCGDGGYQLAGWMPGNDIVVKVWKKSDDIEFNALVTYEDGASNTWGDLYTVITELDGRVSFQYVDLDGVILNNISLYLQPEDTNVEAVFEGIDVVIAATDQGEYYIPNNNVETFSNWNNGRGVQVLTSDAESYTMSVLGFDLDPYASIALDPFMLNNIGYTLAEPTSIESVFSQLDDGSILAVADDQGHYYIPGYGLNTIDESGGMKPGKGYQVLISGSETIEFAYGEADGAGLGRNLAIVGASENYEITRTGVSHPMVINQITGMVSEGDELVAYANGIPVGVAPVDVEGSTLLVAWKSLYEYGLDTDGYQDGDDIEIRLFSQEYGQELRVMADLNVAAYGESPITMGSIHVLNELAVPAEFGLEQNYPNPFNPSTTIDVSVASDSYIMLNVYDINGRLISTLADDTFDTGYHSFVWNGLDQSGNKVSAGIYFYSLQTNEMTLTKKMILMK